MSLQLITTLEIMVVEKSKRRRWSMDEWRAVQARYAGSGLPLRTFCLREGINLSSFYRWRERCVGVSEPCVQEASRSVPVVRARPVLPPAEFVDLGQLRASSSRVELRLDLGDGLLLTLVRS